MRNVSPFARNLLILGVVALAIVILNQQTALATAGTLLRFAFFIAIAVVGYFFWRDFGRIFCAAPASSMTSIALSGR